jgi:hypothetical protein
MASTEEINYSVFEAQDVRLVLKNRSQCLRAGFPISHPIIVTFNEIRDEYIKRVGLATYLSQMLGPLAVVPISRCTLYQTDSREIVVHLSTVMANSPSNALFEIISICGTYLSRLQLLKATAGKA